MDLTFQAGSGAVIARVLGKRLFFIQYVNNSPVMFPLEKINFPKEGMLKEFPDLEGREYNEMKNIAVERIREHLGKMNTEKEVEEYIKKELEGIGCKLIMKSKPGFRPTFYKEGREIGVNAK